MTTATSEPHAGAKLVTLAAWGALALLLILLSSYAWQGPDIFYHLNLGRRIVESGAAQPPDQLLVQQPNFINIYWLFQLGAYGLYRVGGVHGISIAFMLVWFVTLGTWLRTTSLAHRPLLGPALTLGALLILQIRFQLRPEILSYLFLSMQVYWLNTWSMDRALSWRQYALFAITEILWVNIHGYFALGPLLVVARLLSAIVHREDRLAVVQGVRLLAVTLLATIVSPFGVKTWYCVYVLWEFLRDMRGQIDEFGPPLGVFLRLWTVKLFWVYWLATMIMGAWLVFRRQWRAFPLALAVAGLYLSATSTRGLPIFLMLAGPLWGSFFAEVGRRFRSPRPRWTVAVPAATLVAALALATWIPTGGFYDSLLGGTSFGISLSPYAYPLQFHRYLERTRFAGSVFNNATDGGYLEYHFPRLEIYMDSRYTDAPMVREYFAALRQPEVFLEVHARHDFDGALLRVADSDRLVFAMIQDPRWRLAYADLHRAFLVRAESERARRLPQELRFYQGEDLSARANGRSAIAWVNLLIQSRRRELLLPALKRFAEAPAIPSFVVGPALEYGLRTGDLEIVAVARGMVPSVLIERAQARDALDKLVPIADRALQEQQP